MSTHTTAVAKRHATILLLLLVALLAPGLSDAKRHHRRGRRDGDDFEKWREDKRQREILRPHDPNFRVGQWGRYGRVNHGPEWMHREMRARTILRRSAAAAAERQGTEDEEPKERDAEPSEAAPPAWVKPSPLTGSGVPPIVIHVPMTDKERENYLQRLGHDEVARHLGSPKGANDEDERDLPPPQPYLPAAYVDRVKQLAQAAGFEYVMPAAATVLSEHHVVHAQASRVVELLRIDGPEDEETRQGGLDQTPALPPRRPTEDVPREPRDAAEWHEWATRGTAEMEQPSDLYKGYRQWQTRFDKTMREQNARAAGRRRWRTEYLGWEKGAHAHPRRRAMVSALRNALLSTKGVESAEPQHPQPRVLRRSLPSQPTHWQSYRERPEADDGDDRPARHLDGDPRKRGVTDPLLTEQWNLYDAAAWGDLPPGVYAKRPSMSAGPAIWDVLGHPELVHRYARATSYDALNSRRNRPPTPVDPWVETHGTQAAGVALAERGNGVCGSGVAPGARLGAIRLLGLRSPTDAEEAAAVSHACLPHGAHPSHNVLINSIYSCSWGPVDDGADLRGPGPLALAALKACVHGYGRHDKGSIYVWAGGNGRTQGDNGNYDGYANLPETIAVGAIDDMENQAWYSEPCACLLVSAPSSGGSSGIVSSDPSGGAGLSQGRCTRNFGGTSAAAPSVAGVVALMLQHSPDLGWRDVQHLLVRSAQRIQPRDHREPWTQNAAGYWHSHGYGFGLLNATRAVLLASSWSALRTKEPLVEQTAILTAAATWDGESSHSKRGDPTPEPPTDTERFSRYPIDTSDYDPETGNHAASYARTESSNAKEEEEGEPLAGEVDDPKTAMERNAERTESVTKSIAFFAPRFLAYKTRQAIDVLKALSEEAMHNTREARRARRPNRVMLLGEGGRNGLAIPPGFSAHLDHPLPAATTKITSLEHVGLRLDASTPSNRGMLRIWLCAPSGTCSLMAPAPHFNDRHKEIRGSGWTYWSVRHWGERAHYGNDDRTGHGPGTWSLRLTHAWPADRHKAHKLRDKRVRTPEQVDMVVRWWQLEMRGNAVGPGT